MKSFIASVSLLVLALPAIALTLKANATDKNEPSAIRATPPAPKFSDIERQTELAKRRAKVFAAMDDKSVLILFSAQPKIYTNDVDFLYRQENNLYYLTSLKQNGVTLILIKDGTQQREILSLPKRNPANETWNGRMYSSEDATRISGIKNVTDASERDTFLQAIKDKTVSSFFTENIYLLLPEGGNDADGMREFAKENEFAKTLNGFKVKNAQPIFANLRLIKSPFEIKVLQHAIDITTEAQERAMAMVGRAKWEYEVQAEVEYTFRRRNADYWGYPSIVGCGPNATTLHYVESQGAVKQGDLMLMDVGAEYDHYTADVTRTYPANGKFSKEQAEIYQAVYDAQEAAAKTLKPGARFEEPAQAAAKSLEQSLAKLGLITGVGAFVPGTEREVPDGLGGKRKIGMPQYRLWYMHGWGHWLGMNVHDVGGGGKTVLQPGMVFTNEPGIYIREDALNYLPDTPEVQAFVAKIKPAFEKYKNIGVRIEDDMLITDTGIEWMTKNLPRRINEIEALMAKASKEIPYSNLKKETNPTFAILDNYNFAADNFAWNPFAPNKLMDGKTIRRGWISTERETAFSGLLHDRHQHGE
ncbi:MAG TPA: aminopeptidase P family protein [Pyrinomonadaceae bacterium]|nr:aminopeptidase P family protein [Pyrinomonadaceae bacterium]